MEVVHSTYTEIVKAIKAHLPFNLTEKEESKLESVLAFGPMFDKFELVDNTHYYSLHIITDEITEEFPPKEYQNIEPDSTGVISFSKDADDDQNILIENYIKCDDGTGDIVMYIGSKAIIYESLLDRRLPDYSIKI